jgi:hypothetical protein
MRTMWKFQLTGSQVEIKIPSYKPVARHVAFQKNVYGDGLYVWIDIPDDLERIFGYTFYTICTGDSIPPEASYVGSAEDPITKEVIHVYMK